MSRLGKKSEIAVIVKIKLSNVIFVVLCGCSFRDARHKIAT